MGIHLNQTNIAKLLVTKHKVADYVMAYIIKGYPSIENYRLDVEFKPDKFRPEYCENCGCHNLWIHGFYMRGVIRKDAYRSIEEAVMILRFKCASCFHTMSTLPEFICPRRWYLWCMQELVIKRCLQNEATKTIAADLKLSRDTVYRWISWIVINHDQYSKELSALYIGLGIGPPPNKFWLFLFTQGTLSRIMFQLHRLKITVP